MVARELNDPRLFGVVSITRVETTSDLRHARVFVSVLGKQEEKESVLQGINSAMGFMRKEMKARLSLKYIPELTFILDESMEEAEYIFKLMDRLSIDDESDEESPARIEQSGPGKLAGNL
jgi:ribosome-binding factor A